MTLKWIKVELPSANSADEFMAKVTKWEQRRGEIGDVVNQMYASGRTVAVGVFSDAVPALQSFLTRNYAGFRWTDPNVTPLLRRSTRSQ